MIDSLTQPNPEPLYDPRVQRGLRWAAIRQVITAVVGTVGAVIYTRFLQPEDLGAFGLASLVYSGLFLLIQAPVRDAIVYYQSEEEARSSAAFWLLAGFSGVAVTLVMLLADVFAQFYQSPLAAGLTRGMAIAFLFQAVAVVPASLLLKHFQFVVYERWLIVIQLILFAGWITLSAAGMGPWSLVIPNIVGSLLWAIIVWSVAHFRPIWQPGRNAYQDIIQFSRSLVGSKAIIYINRNLDNAAVGTLGERFLGWYGVGESQAAYYGLLVSATVAQMTLPAMAAAQEQIEKRRQIFLDMLRFTAMLSTPLQVGAIILADLGIGIFLGAQWLGSVPVLRAYLALWLVYALVEICDAATSAVGRPDIRFRIDLVQLPLFMAGTWVGLQVWGTISGIAWTLVIIRATIGLVYLVATLRLLAISVGALLRYVWPSSLAALLAGGVVYGVRVALLPMTAIAVDLIRLGDVLGFLLLILSGMISYGVFLYLLDRAGFKFAASLTAQIILPASVQARLRTMRRRFADQNS